MSTEHIRNVADNLERLAHRLRQGAITESNAAESLRAYADRLTEMTDQ